MASQNPTNDQVEMVMKLVEKQQALKLLWGDRYYSKITPVVDLVKEIMKREGTKALPTVITMAKALEKSGKTSELREAALLVAAVEIMQEG